MGGLAPAAQGPQSLSSYLTPDTPLDTTYTDISQEIEHLISLGLRHKEDILWKSSNVVDVESILNAFRPSNLLSNDAILEILHILATGRDDAQIMDSQYLCSAVWESKVGGNSD